MTKPKVPKQNPESYRRRLRFFFLAFLRHSSPCRAAVRDLTAEWNTLTKTCPELSSVARFHDLPAPEHLDDPLYAYMAHVKSTVAHTLRCCANGEPADWVCQELHEAAGGTGPDPRELLQPETLMSMDVSLMVSTGGWGWVWTRKNAYPVGDPFIISDKPDTAFASWEQLRKAAHECVDAAIDTMQAEVDSITSSWIRKYERSYTTDTTVRIPKLVRWLVGEDKPPTLGARSAAYELLNKLGLDTPGRS